MSSWESAGKSNEWYTPKYIFDALECNFDMDVAAAVDRTYSSVPTNRFITSNSLDLEWNGFIWMNPPFGKRMGLSPWLDKINDHGNGIALAPDRTSAPWWQKAARECGGLLQVDGKIKFIKPGGTTGDSPGTGTTLFAYGKRGQDALIRAHNNKLGIYFKAFKK